MTHSWTVRCALTLLVLHFASACDSKPPAPPPTGTDTTAPSTRASPAGGTYTAGVTVSLLCDDGAGSGCAATHYTTDGSEPSRGSPTFRDALPLSANTTLKFFSVDKQGNAEPVKSEVYTFTPPGADTQPPTVSASPVGGTYDGPRTVTLTCEDAGGSGCAAIHYTLDGATPTTGSPRYTSALSVASNTTLKFLAVDGAGNTSSVGVQVYVIDTAAPTTLASPSGDVYAQAQQVTLTCDDAGGSGCTATYYTLDGSTPTTSSARYTGPLALSATTTLKFFSVDAAGNRESVHTERYVIDLLAPSTTARPAGGAYNTRQDVTLSCNDGVGTGCAATHFTLNGSTPTTLSPRYTEGTVLPISSNTTLKFFSVDAAGNTEPVQTQTYFIDTTPPTTTATPGAGTYGGTRNVTLSCADDSGSGCKVTYYTTNGTAPGAGSPQYESGKPIPITSNTVLRFLSVDNAGNAEPVQVLEYKIDVLPPVTTASPKGGSYNAARDVTLACADATSTCSATYYTLDGSTPSTSSTRYEDKPLRIATRATLKFFSVDAVGNAEPVSTESYVIDTAAPTVSASPTGGFFRGTRSVTLACDDGTGSGCVGTIWYTTDGSEPTTASSVYSESKPPSLTATTPLKFFSKDAVGNASAVRTETYTLDDQSPTTTASPAGGTVTETVNVTLTCGDADGSGCEGTWYTVDGSTPTTSSTRYGTSAISISGTTTLKFFSTDKLGNVEPVRTETYVFPDPAADTSAQIAAVRDAAEGSIHLPIQEALVTYVKPKTDTDPAGFFLQARKSGPALFVGVDPASLSPVPLPGDVVSLVATQKAPVTATATAGQTRVTSLEAGSFLVHRRGESLTPLLSDASAVDLVGQLGDYESEYLTVSGTLTSAFSASGAGHMQAGLSTVGNPNTPGTFTDLKLRMPTPLLSTLQDRYDLHQGCSVTTTGPLWRYFTAAQPSAWEEKDLQVLSCPAPRPLNVVPTSGTSLTVRFNRRIRPESVASSGDQFTFDNGLVATSATVVDNEVRLTTSAQEEGRDYTLTVAGTVQDIMGTGVDATARSRSFVGFEKPALLRINEVAPNRISSDGTTLQRDVVELYVVAPGSTANMTLTTDNFLVAVLPRVQVTAGDIIVVHLNPDAATNRDAPASETLGKSEYPKVTHNANYDTAWDFHGLANGFIAYTNLNGGSPANAVLRMKDPAGNTQDAVAFAQPSTSPTAGFPALLQAIQAEGLWLPADCLGALCTYSSYPTATEVSASWSGLFPSTSNRSANTVYRIGNADTDGGSDWVTGTASLGLANP